jgi:hypothetical protein
MATMAKSQETGIPFDEETWNALLALSEGRYDITVSDL